MACVSSRTRLLVFALLGSACGPAVPPPGTPPPAAPPAGPSVVAAADPPAEPAPPYRGPFTIETAGSIGAFAFEEPASLLVFARDATLRRWSTAGPPERSRFDVPLPEWTRIHFGATPRDLLGRLEMARSSAGALALAVGPGLFLAHLEPGGVVITASHRLEDLWQVTELAFLPDGRVLASIGTLDVEREVRGALVVWDPPTDGWTVLETRDTRNRGCAVSPDGAWVAAAWTDGPVVYDLRSGARVAASPLTSTHDVQFVGPTRLVVAGFPTVALDLPSTATAWTLRRSGMRIASTVDGARLAITHAAPTVISVIETATGRVVAEVPRDPVNGSVAIAGGFVAFTAHGPARRSEHIRVMRLDDVPPGD